MTAKTGPLLTLNQQIRQALAEDDLPRAEALDQARLALIMTLDPGAPEVQDALRATLQELHAQTRTLEADLHRQNRQRRNAAQAQSRYRAHSAAEKGS